MPSAYTDPSVSQELWRDTWASSICSAGEISEAYFRGFIKRTQPAAWWQHWHLYFSENAVTISVWDGHFYVGDLSKDCKKQTKIAFQNRVFSPVEASSGKKFSHETRSALFFIFQDVKVVQHGRLDWLELKICLLKIAENGNRCFTSSTETHCCCWIWTQRPFEAKQERFFLWPHISIHMLGNISCLLSIKSVYCEEPTVRRRLMKYPVSEMKPLCRPLLFVFKSGQFKANQMVYKFRFTQHVV